MGERGESVAEGSRSGRSSIAQVHRPHWSRTVALGHAAVAEGRRVRYLVAADLVKRLLRGLADNSVDRVIDGLLRHDLVLVDEIGFAPLDATGSPLLFASWRPPTSDARSGSPATSASRSGAASFPITPRPYRSLTASFITRSCASPRATAFACARPASAPPRVGGPGEHRARRALCGALACGSGTSAGTVGGLPGGWGLPVATAGALTWPIDTRRDRRSLTSSGTRGRSPRRRSLSLNPAEIVDAGGESAAWGGIRGRTRRVTPRVAPDAASTQAISLIRAARYAGFRLSTRGGVLR